MSIENNIIDKIYDCTNGGLDILEFFYNAVKEAKVGKTKFKLRPTEHTPSAVLVLNNGKYCVIDYGDDSKPRDAINVVEIERGCNTSDAVKWILQNFNIDNDGKKATRKANVTFRNELQKDEEVGQYYFDEFYPEVTEEHLKVLGKYVTDAHCKQYKFKSVKKMRYVTLKKEDKTPLVITSESTPDFPIFLIEGQNTKKLYRPFDQKHLRFMHIGKFDDTFLFGLEQAKIALKKKKEEYIKATGQDAEIDEEQEVVETKETYDSVFNHKTQKLRKIIIASGGSDSINIVSFGFFPVWGNSETFRFTAGVISELYKIADEVLVCFDLDDTGIKSANEICKNYWNIKNIKLPKWLLKYKDSRGYTCKDVKDFANKLHIKKGDDASASRKFEVLVNEAICLCPYVRHVAKTGSISYKFDMEQAFALLKALGYYKYEHSADKNGFIFIKITGQIISQIKDYAAIKTALREFVREKELDRKHVKKDVLNMLRRSTALTKTAFESDLEYKEIQIQNGGPDYQLFFFKNKTVKVMANSIEFFEPKTIDAFVWEHKIVDHAIVKKEPAFTITYNENIQGPDGKKGFYTLKINDTDCLFLQFIQCVSNVHWRKTDKNYNGGIDAELTNEQQYEVTMHIINKLFIVGYLLAEYKHNDKAWAPYALDANNKDISSAEGGSGKSTFYETFWKYTNLLTVDNQDGRNKSLLLNRHWNENITKDTDVVFFDDLDRFFDMGELYNIVTKGMKVNPKHSKSVELSYTESPKLVFASNFAPIDDQGSSHRRLLYTAFSDFFHDNTKGHYKETRSIKDHFKKQLFTDFTEPEWNSFYNTILTCTQFFFSHLQKVNPPMDDLTENAGLARIGEQFKEWVEVFYSPEMQPCKLDVMVSRDEIKESWVKTVGIKNAGTPQSFKKKMKSWCDLMGYTFNPERLHTDHKSHRIIKDSVEQYYVETHKKPDQPEDEELSPDDLPF